MTNTTLEDLAVHHFDDLVRRRELLWTDTLPEVIRADPFDFEFRIAPAYEQKPILANDAKGRTEDTGAFGDDDPAFVISTLRGTHTLRLNKFCVIRPQFVLHTVNFEPQQNLLSLQDVLALWQALCELGREQYAGIYNCGAQAGSSIGHKHMQLFPRSHQQALFPDDLLPSDHTLDHLEEPLKHHKVPFEHAILPVARNATGDAVFSAYQTLCKHYGLGRGSPHNVFLTDVWIIVIPRRHARVDNMAANAASMLGMIWVKTKSDLQDWKDYGPMNVLREVGIECGPP